MPPVNAQTLASGDFSSGFEAYLGDNLGFRSFFTDMSEKITENTGFTTELGKLVSVNKDVGNGHYPKGEPACGKRYGHGGLFKQGRGLHSGISTSWNIMPTTLMRTCTCTA